MSIVYTIPCSNCGTAVCGEFHEDAIVKCFPCGKAEWRHADTAFLINFLRDSPYACPTWTDDVLASLAMAILDHVSPIEDSI